MKVDSFKLRNLAMNKGWSLRKLAEKAGIGHATIYSLADNKRKHGFSADKLYKVAIALGVKTTDLIIED